MNIRFFAIFAITATVVILNAGQLEEIEAKLVKVGAEQLQLHGDTRNAAEKLDQEFRSGKYDTEEMKALRQRIEELKEEIRKTNAELRQKFDELPQFKDQVATVNTNFARVRELGIERQRLLQEREKLQKK